MSLNNDYLESLITIKGERIELREELLDRVDNYVSCLGPPGAGKSTFCNAFYRQLYNTSKTFFEASDNDTSFTKGLWVLKEQERQKIEMNIPHDIIDAEGFQVDDIKSWKYVMIIAFISTDIVLLSRDGRSDALKRVFGILKISFQKMNNSNIPRVLKNILVQMSTEEKMDKFELEDFYEKMNCSEDDFKGITIKPFFIPPIEYKQLKQNPDVLSYQDFLESINYVRSQFTPGGMVNSVSHLKKHIQNFNGALNGDISFNTQNIIKELQLDYNACYLRWEQQKIAELKQTPFTDLLSSSESYEDYLKRHNIDFHFEENLEDLTFYCNSNQFMEHYQAFHKEKSFIINDNNQLLKTDYELKVAKCKCDEEKIQAQLKIEQQKKDTQDQLEKAELQTKAHIESERIKRENEIQKFNEESAAKYLFEKNQAEALFQQQKKAMQDLQNAQLKETQAQFQQSKENSEKLLREQLQIQNKMKADYEASQKQILLENENLLKLKKAQLEKERLDNQVRIEKEKKETEDKLEADRQKLKATLELSEKMSQIIQIFSWKKQQIDKYFESIKFNGSISPSYDFSINIIGNDPCRREYELKLNQHYQLKIKEKQDSFKNQIQLAKWKNVVQCHGTMTCKGGCKISAESVSCSRDQGIFYWVDGETKQAICNKCENVETMSGLVCNRCGKEVNCQVKYL